MENLKKKTWEKEAPTLDLRFGYVPPQSTKLEEAILGAIMVDISAYDAAAEILTPNCFYSNNNQRIFAAMQSLAKKNAPIDLLTVCEELKALGSLDIVGGAYAVSKLTNEVMTGAHIPGHADMILRNFIKREIIRAAGEMITAAYDDSTDAYHLLDSAEEKMMQIGTTNVQGGMMEISEVLKQAIDKIEEWRQNDGTMTGVPTGLEELDKATRGWQPGDLIIIGARPSVGKTALALNLIRNAALDVHKPTVVAAWSLEMKAVYLALRMIAAESDIYLHRLQTGKLEEWQMKQLFKKGIEKLLQAKIFFDDSSNINLRTLRAKARRLKKKNNLGLIVIDYLQLMEGEDGKGNREQEISKISRGLKNLAQELDIPIIALSQLTRDADKTIGWDKGPGISALRESGAIEQDADVVILLWGPTEEEVKKDPSLDGKRKIKIAKQRNGMLATIELEFRNEIQLFKAIDENLPNSFKPVYLDYTTSKSTQDDVF